MRYHGELSCVHLNGEWQFPAKSHAVIGAFWLVFLTEHEVLHCYTTNAVYRFLVARQSVLIRLADSLQQTVNASKFPTLVRKFTQQPSCTILF